MKGRVIALLVLIYVCAAMQWAWDARHPAYGSVLMFLPAILAGMTLPRLWATLLGGLSGLLTGLVIAQGVGVSTPLTALVAFVLGTSVRIGRAQEPLKVLGIAFVAAALGSLTRMFLVPGVSAGMNVFTALVGATVIAALTLPLSAFLRRLTPSADRDLA